MRMKDGNSKVVAFTIVPHQEDEEEPTEENNPTDGSSVAETAETNAESVANDKQDSNPTDGE